MWIGHHKEILKADISSISFNQIDVSSVSLGSGWQHTSKPETTITPILICFICFGSRVEKEELRVHPVDNLAIINNIWYPARPLAAVIKYSIQKIKVFVGFTPEGKRSWSWCLAWKGMVWPAQQEVLCKGSIFALCILYLYLPSLTGTKSL